MPVLNKESIDRKSFIEIENQNLLEKKMFQQWNLDEIWRKNYATKVKSEPSEKTQVDNFMDSVEASTAKKKRDDKKKRENLNKIKNGAPSSSHSWVYYLTKKRKS